MRELTWRHVWLVARREYLEIVRNKWFVVMTILTPFLMIAWGVLPSMLMMRKTEAKRTIVIVSEDAVLGDAIKARLLEDGPTARPKEDRRNESLVVDYDIRLSGDASNANRQRLEQQMDSREIDGFLWLDGDALKQRIVTYTARKTNDFVEIEKIQTAVRQTVMQRTFRAYGLTDAQIQDGLSRVNLEAIQWDAGKQRKSNFLVQLFTLLVLGLAMFLTVMIYGIGVMRAVLEEKTNRVMEVLMSSLTSTELMTGKILGVGAAGLTQIALWALMVSVVAVPGTFSMRTVIRDANLSAVTAAYFMVFFLLGYFLYASLSAAIGAMVSTEREAQQIQQFIMMPLGISFAIMFFAMRAPSDPAVVAISMIPFCAPLVMFMRVVVETPPLWQIALSITLLVATIVALFFLCGRIYRVGILMYGKRATLPEILKWIRYA